MKPVCEKCQDTGKVCDRSGLWNCLGYDEDDPLGLPHNICQTEPCACPAGDPDEEKK